MPDFAVDTNVLLRFMARQKDLPEEMLQYLREAESGNTRCFVPAVVPMEMLYLFEKRRIPKGVGDVAELLGDEGFELQPLDLGVLLAAVPIDDIPELHDRLIAATAGYLNVPLLTLDPVIKSSRHVRTLV